MDDKEKKDEWTSCFPDDITTPPKWALKTIKGGRLKGMTDINPQWRIEAMTKKYGLIGVGWKFNIKRVWAENGAGNEKFAFAEVEVCVKDKESGNWSEPVPGYGGSMLVSEEANGLYSQDEGYKMAITDALSVALKFFGVGGKVYAGQMDNDGEKVVANSDSKYAYNERRGYGELTLPPENELIDFLKKQPKPSAYYRLVKASGYKPEIISEAINIMYPK